MTVLIACKKLSYTYEKETIITNLNFDIFRGDYLVIVGANGVGKSTVMRGILKFIKPAAGEVVYCNELSLKHIGYLPQQTPLQKDFPVSVNEVVLSGCLGKKSFWSQFYSAKDKEVALSNMKKFHIESFQKKCYRELSGGQQQRVLLARALCAATKLIALDEPASGLDSSMTGEMYQIISKLNESGITVVMVSHDTWALRYAKHVLHMSMGKTFYGTLAEYKSSEFAKKIVEVTAGV